MKITNKRTETKAFRDIEQGKVFCRPTDYSSIYIKTEVIKGDHEMVNALNLLTGEFCYFEFGNYVIPVDSELIIR